MTTNTDPTAANLGNNAPITIPVSATGFTVDTSGTSASPVEISALTTNETVKAEQSIPLVTITSTDVITPTPAEPTNAATTEKKISEPLEKIEQPKSKSSTSECVSILISCLLIAIPILEVIIGSKYENKCPANKQIPKYLFVAGIVGIVILALTIMQGVLGLSALKRALSSESQSAILGIICKLCGACGLGLIIIGLAIFLFAWFIAGCVWIFGSWSKIQYDNKMASNYCHPTLYRFAFWLLIFSIAKMVYPCVKGCVSSGVGKSKNKKDGAIRVPTSEP